ncbi:MAG: hypothetical protein M1828_004899 [Chrysothrix sp. TS-e1954]|nr:MAG: hypothetical protein M1828_004899 [Chrysothrix sp. TS-e1954]
MQLISIPTIEPVLAGVSSNGAPVYSAASFEVGPVNCAPAVVSFPADSSPASNVSAENIALNASHSLGLFTLPSLTCLPHAERTEAAATRLVDAWRSYNGIMQSGAGPMHVQANLSDGMAVRFANILIPPCDNVLPRLAGDISSFAPTSFLNSKVASTAPMEPVDRELPGDRFYKYREHSHVNCNRSTQQLIYVHLFSIHDDYHNDCSRLQYVYSSGINFGGLSHVNCNRGTEQLIYIYVFPIHDDCHNDCSRLQYVCSSGINFGGLSHVNCNRGTEQLIYVYVYVSSIHDDCSNDCSRLQYVCSSGINFDGLSHINCNRGTQQLIYVHIFSIHGDCYNDC